MYKKIVIAALLHDIGKLIMRADGFNKNHSITGVEYLTQFNNSLFNDESVLEAIRYHHAKDLINASFPQKKSHIAYIIYEADNIASGIDRKEDLENEVAELKTKWEKFDKTLCLNSIFNHIGSDKTDYIYKLKDLEDNSPNYPENDKNLIAPKENYKKIKNWIDKNINSIKNPNSLLQLLEATMNFIPSSTDTTQVTDISLYDHLKLTAAIASCMYSFFEEKQIFDYKEKCFTKVERNENYYKLVSFDISGIQNFIYTISSKNALKSLRDRSFYLEFIMEHIQDELLEKLNLSRANILYSGGGHSYLLLPNTSTTNKVLTNLCNVVNRWLFDKFSTELYFACANVECSSNDLMQSQEKFKELSKKLSKAKLQRYSNEQLEEIFSLKKNIDTTRECVICKQSGKLDENNICEFCQNLIELGQYLVNKKDKKDFIIVVSSEKEQYSIELPTLSDEKKYFQIKINQKDMMSKNNQRYYAINNFSTGDYFVTNIWMGDYCMHKKTGETYTFEDFAGESNGINRIGVFRADVDNLGSTFTKGFGDYSSISRYATLSRMLNMFFKRYINNLCNNKKLAIVYSGGDDVFIVGAWNDVLNFAQELKVAFQKYSCQKLSLSAGIGFFNSSYPISKMAELTGDLEDFAKKNNNNQKDSIALFGENKSQKDNEIITEQLVFKWDEFDEILELQKYIEERCYFDENEKKDDKVFFSTALIYKIMTLINSSEEINLARYAYTLARMENNSVFYKELKATLYEKYQKDKKKLLTALNLIIYKNRK
jgi:CRISPR-associated protein Csm1